MERPATASSDVRSRIRVRFSISSTSIWSALISGPRRPAVVTTASFRSIAGARPHKSRRTGRKYLISLAAAVLRLFEQIEEPRGVLAGERFQPVGLSLFDCVARLNTFGAKPLCLFLHEVLPPHRVQFPD